MNRAKDLDSIAPDDPIESTSSSKPTSSSKSKPSKTTISSKSVNNQNEEFRQKIYSILGHTKSPFSAFLVKPKVFDFQERDSDEEIFLAVRPHWFTNATWVLTAIAMLFVPFIISYSGALSFLPATYQLVSVLFWYLITFIFAFEKFLSWYFDVYILTNERVVDIDFNNMLNKHFAEADIAMIQDVSSSVKGVAGTLFNYGTVLIQTASEVNQIIFDKVPNPEKIIKVLQQLREAAENEGGNQ